MVAAAGEVWRGRIRAMALAAAWPLFLYGVWDYCTGGSRFWFILTFHMFMVLVRPLAGWLGGGLERRFPARRNTARCCLIGALVGLTLLFLAALGHSPPRHLEPILAITLLGSTALAYLRSGASPPR